MPTQAGRSLICDNYPERAQGKQQLTTRAHALFFSTKMCIVLFFCFFFFLTTAIIATLNGASKLTIR